MEPPEALISFLVNLYKVCFRVRNRQVSIVNIGHTHRSNSRARSDSFRVVSACILTSHEECYSLYGVLAENHVPQVLHDPPTRPILQLRIQDPLPVLQVIFLRPSEHPFSRHRKLRATGRAYFLGLLSPIEQFRPYLRCDMRVDPIIYLTARVPVAAQIDVPVASHEAGSELAQRVGVVVEGGVGVPGGPETVAVRVDEGHDCWEGVVVVDDVG